ncbi:MAG: DJ-1/PfpI family protein [Allosphingosinicella sp.]|uniref:DJ-1/PfpI family protein n=1 Tax=Allosphingosinicella sp. TaxID=2823234 RepID=UPI003963712B
MRILIYLFDGVTALDAIGPYESLSRLPDVDILFVARAQGPLRTGDGFLGLHADAAIGEAGAADMLIVPGGQRDAVAREARDPELLAWLRTIDAVTRRTCSVCTGAILLAAAGLLSGRRAATHWRARDILPKLGVRYSGERVTADGKYLTSAGVSAGIDMGLTLCAEIAGRELAEAAQLSMEYDPRPPFDAGDHRTAGPERIALVETLRT